jgi:thiopeptide-type bacteriocin biosynthesis protein
VQPQIEWRVNPVDGKRPSRRGQNDLVAVGAELTWHCESSCRIRSISSLNQTNAPAVVRFLADIAYDGKAQFSTFDWGPAEGFPFLPRVEAGRVVLRPAEWRLRKGDLESDSDEAYRRALEQWHAEWDVPRYVCLSFIDNRLVLDLEDLRQAAELKSELMKLNDGSWMVLQEVMPSLEDAWLPGSGGQFYSEFVVSLVLSRNAPTSIDTNEALAERQHQASEIAVASPELAKDEVPSQTSRRQPAGTEWLFVKLYCPKNLEDDVICDSMYTFAENAVASGFAESWFFIRYADPEAHIRLRFHGMAEALTRQLFPHVCEWANRLMSSKLCLKFQLDTYEQEIERFGGPEGMRVSEEIFAADSRTAVALMRLSKARTWPHDQIIFLAFGIDDLLKGLGLSESELRGWYTKKTTPGGQDVGSDYRERKNVLRTVIGRPGQLFASYEGGSALATSVEQRHKALAGPARRLRELADTGRLEQPLDDLLSSFVHLHLNRVGSAGAQAEPTILSLLLRTRESLEKAPV